MSDAPEPAATVPAATAPAADVTPQPAVGVPSGGAGPGTETTGSDAFVHGRVVRRSDVSDIPDEPVTAGAVVVVPADAQRALWTAVGVPAAGPPTPRKVEFEVTEEMLPAGAEIATLGADGTFVTGVPAGEVLVCLADDLPGDTPGPPYRVNGCDAFSGSGVTLTTGFGGIIAQEG